MRLSCIGCGPGDPELLTVKGIDRLKAADIIFGPTSREGKQSIAIGVVEKYIDREHQTVRALVFPMKKDKESLVEYWKKNAAEIAKSVVFRGKDSGQAVVVVASGDNRVSEAKVAACVGEALGRADADFVRSATGYAIGGVAPIGHAQAVKLLLDEDLQRFARLWAAAGTPFSVFPLTPAQLQALTVSKRG